MTALRHALALLVSVAVLPGAQSIPGAVLAKNEPHHHLAYEDAALRVLRVRVPARDTTLLHEHDPDYFWIALGASEVVNARPGVPDATIRSADLGIHYTTGHFAHVARNPGAVAFENITVELLGAQGAVRNRCEEAVAGAPLSCPAGPETPQSGVAVHRAFETDRLRVDLVTVAAGATLSGAAAQATPWIIALHADDTARLLRTAVPSFHGPAVSRSGMDWHGGVWRGAPQYDWSVTNAGTTPIQVIEVTPIGR